MFLLTLKLKDQTLDWMKDAQAMRTPRVRLTIRHMMVAVAMVAMILGFGLGLLNGKDRRKKYAGERLNELIWELGRDEMEKDNLERRKASERELSRLEDLRKWHYFLKIKYCYIYKYPLIPVWPDSPEPNPGLNTKRIILE